MARRVAIAGWTQAERRGRLTWTPDVDLSGSDRWAAVDLSDVDGREVCVVVVDYPGVLPPLAALSKGGEAIDGDSRMSQADTAKFADRLGLRDVPERVTAGELCLLALAGKVAAEKDGDTRVYALGLVAESRRG